MAILGALLFLGTMAVMMTKALTGLEAAPAAAASHGYKASSSQGAWDFTNPEVDQMVDELRRERAQMQTRAKELDELALRIQTDRNELNTLLANVKQLQTEFDSSILRVQQDEFSNLKKLAKLYANMEPAGAITILKELDDYSIVKILLYLREQEAAPILEALARQGPAEALRAAAISESIRTSTSAKVGAAQPGPATVARNSTPPAKPAPTPSGPTQTTAVQPDSTKPAPSGPASPIQAPPAAQPAQAQPAAH